MNHGIFLATIVSSISLQISANIDNRRNMSSSTRLKFPFLLMVSACFFIPFQPDSGVYAAAIFLLSAASEHTGTVYA